MLKLRSTNPLLTLGSAELIKGRVTFPNAGADQTAGLIVMHVADPAGAGDHLSRRRDCGAGGAAAF